MNKKKFVFGWVSKGKPSRSSGEHTALDPAFLRAVTSTTLPTVKEEQKYGRIIQSAVRRITKTSKNKSAPREPLFKKEEIIARFWKREREALHALVTRNLRMVMLIAKRFYHPQMRTDDLVGYGIEGLYNAALRFDPTRKIKFCTYATWWVRHHIQRAIDDHGSTVRTPVHEFERRRDIYYAQIALAQKLGREPTRSELACKLRISKKKIEDTLAHTVMVHSLNITVSGDDASSGREYGDLLFYSDEHMKSPEQETELDIDSEKLRKAMDEVLEPREREVLHLRFSEEITLNQAAAHPRMRMLQKRGKALSRERVRQLQEQALSKLREALLAP